MSLIQQPPWGYLHTLGLKTTGRNPVDANPNVQPTLEMTPFYMSGHLSSSSGNNAATAAVGDVIALTPGPGIGWMLVGAQYSLLAGAAGEQARLALRISGGPGGKIRVDSTDLMTAVAANAVLSKGMLFSQPFLLLGGLSIEAIVDDINVAGARWLNVAAYYYEIEL